MTGKPISEDSDSENVWRQCRAEGCDDVVTCLLRYRIEFSNGSATYRDSLCPYHCAHREREVRTATDKTLERLDIVTADFDWGDSFEAFACYNVDVERELSMLYEYLLNEGDIHPLLNEREIDPLLESRLEGVEATLRIFEGNCEMNDIVSEWSEPWEADE